MSDPTRKLSWDDLRIVRAVARTGAVAAAAEMLGINSSTAARRLAKIEEVLGVALFDRRRTGYVATTQGEEVVALAERVELDVIGVTRRVSGHAQGHAGDLRITTSESIIAWRVFRRFGDTPTRWVLEDSSRSTPGAAWT